MQIKATRATMHLIIDCSFLSVLKDTACFVAGGLARHAVNTIMISRGGSSFMGTVVVNLVGSGMIGVCTAALPVTNNLLVSITNHLKL